MKKIFLLVLCMFCITLTGCSDKEIKDEVLSDFIDEVLEDIIFKGDSLTIVNETALALNILIEEGIDIDLDDLFDKNNIELQDVVYYYINLEITDVYTAYNMCLVYELLNINTSKLESYFMDPIFDNWGEVTVLNCLNILDVNEVLKEELEIKIKNSFTEFDYNDADTIGLKMMALGADTPGVAKDMIKDYITVDGVLSADFYDYDSNTNYPGESNACSTAMTIIGLLASDEKLSDYSVDEITLYEMLLTFKVEGGFEYNGELDLEYATPQSFLALTCYYISETLDKEVVLY